MRPRLRSPVGRAVTAVLTAAATLLIAGCGSDSNSTTAPSTTKPSVSTTTTPASSKAPSTKKQEALCKDFGGVSPSQRVVPLILRDGVQCKDGIITNGPVTISRPTGGWQTIINPPSP